MVDPKLCPIGSCQRHGKCMYAPCTFHGPYPYQHVQMVGRVLRPVLPAEPVVRVLSLGARRSGKTHAQQLMHDWCLPPCNWPSKPFGQGYDPCDPWDHTRIRPAEPVGKHIVWYRGWEVAHDEGEFYFGKNGWLAHKGGCDLDAPEVSSATYSGVLDEIDEAQNE